MSPDGSQNIKFAFDLEGKAVIIRDSTFPDIPRIIHFLDVKRRVLGVRKQKSQLFFHQFLYPRLAASGIAF